MINTYGLTHIALKVKDVKKSFEFYKLVFGVKAMYVHDHFIQVQTPGTNDIIVFETATEPVDNTRTGFHFGFRLRRPEALPELVSIVERAGGKLRDQGEFVPGEPFLFFYDPDGYEIEVWFENIPDTHKEFN